MPITRETVRNPLTIRRTTVSAVRSIVPNMVRITLSGPELTGFSSTGPEDHVKVFFPDPATGDLTTPVATPNGAQRPEGVIISRDYTPLAWRVGQDGSTELDVDFLLHGDEGPASAWAARAEPGALLGVAGPRGSRLVPEGMNRLIVIADETGLPATSRWLDMVPENVSITGLLDVADESVEDYFDAAQSSRASFEWLYRRDGAGQLEEALRSLGPIDDETFVFLAGEATTLIPLRRHLRRTLELPAKHVSVSGYWKRGVVNLDHHAPVDPTDPD